MAPYGVTIVVLTILATQCLPPGPVDGPVPPPVLEQTDAGCEGMCAHLRELGCEQGKPTPSGATCERVCADTMAEGYDVHPDCVAGVRGCAEVDRASQGGGAGR